MSITTQNINNTFFQGVYKDVWKKLMPPALSVAECDFILEIADLEAGSKVVDIMCGYGRHAIELAKRGIAITAVDNLEDYIIEIQNEAGKGNFPIHAFTADAMNAQLSETFDAAICMGNSFSFFNKEDATLLLKRIASHLKPNGVFIIGSWTIAEIAIRHFREREWRHVEDYKYLIENKFFFHPNRIESEHTLINANGPAETIEGIDYIFTLSELEQMFNHAGLTTKGLYTTPRKKRFSIGDTTIYIVAEKAS